MKFTSLLFLSLTMVTAANASSPAPTATTLAVSGSGNVISSVALGTAVTLTATVTSAGANVTLGTVNFCDATIDPKCGPLAMIGTAQLTAAGTASIVVRLGVGSHSLKALFAGTNADSASASAGTTLGVTGKYGSGTSIASASETSSYNLTATVSGFGPPSLPSPTGTVSFLDTSNSNVEIATADLSSGTITKALGFNNSSNPNLLSNPSVSQGFGVPQVSTVVGDFDGDGKPDFAVTNQSGNTVDVYLGNGDGTFANVQSYPAGNMPSFAATADLNNDGKLDLVVLSFNANTASVLLGNGDGTFKAPMTITIGETPTAVTAADLNGDGKLDLVLTDVDAGIPGCLGFGSVEVILGNGDGTFQAAQDFCVSAGLGGVSPTFVATGDFNGDGKLDVVTANWGNDDNSYSISILLGNGDGTLQPSQDPWEYSIEEPASAVAVGDFNGDGKLDLAVANYSSGYTAPGESSVSVLLGNGDGTFQQPVTYGFPLNTNPFSIVVADFNGDGKADLAIPSANGFQPAGFPFQNNGPLDPVYILLGNGDGTFQQPVGYSATTSTTGTAVDLVATDFNGDGKPDLMFLGQISSTANFAATALLNGGVSTTVTVTGIDIGGSTAQLVQANYGGDAVYAGSASAAMSLTPNGPVLSVVPSDKTLTVAQAGSVTDTLAVSLAAGMAGTLQFACSGLPAASSCSFQPSSLTFNGMNTPAKVTLTIQTGGSTTAAVRSTAPADFAGLAYVLAVAFWLPGRLLSRTRVRRGRRSGLCSLGIALALLVSMVLVTACGSSSQTPRTPKGTSTINVTVTGGGNLAQTVALTLTVQ